MRLNICLAQIFHHYSLISYQRNVSFAMQSRLFMPYHWAPPLDAKRFLKTLFEHIVPSEAIGNLHVTHKWTGGPLDWLSTNIYQTQAMHSTRRLPADGDVLMYYKSLLAWFGISVVAIRADKRVTALPKIYICTSKSSIKK